MAEIREKYEQWLKKATADKDLIQELNSMTEEQMEDSFYEDLAFGTGGLRAVIGAGTNRMNVYTVARATQGIADYIKKNFPEEERSVAISYDSRIKSDVFARVTANVFASNGIRVWIYPQLMPTPCVSYAVRSLKCAAGVMITASHNPSKYNGYKVYGSDGCQITVKAAEEILAGINRTEYFTNEISTDIDAQPLISYVPEEVYDAFIARVRKESVIGNQKIDRNVAIVYSPLNGTGLKPVKRILKETGFENVVVVKEQEQPDGNFPTCPYPNPEIREAMELGIQTAKRENADLLIATDPDCDRVGIAVRYQDDFRLLSGNEVGVLLLDFICSRRMENGTMPESPVAVKTIVTTDMAQRVADKYGVRMINVLTGFKFIGEQIGLLEAAGRADSYILGFEESYGYLSGSYVRDKDAVDGVFMICEMFAWYKTRGISLVEKLQELYQEYGTYYNRLYSFQFEGSAGMKRMKEVMETFRTSFNGADGFALLEKKDYLQGIDGLPKSDVLKFYLQGNTSVVVRPSGTEPKLKIYISVCASDETEAAKQEALLAGQLKKMIG